MATWIIDTLKIVAGLERKVAALESASQPLSPTVTMEEVEAENKRLCGIIVKLREWADKWIKAAGGNAYYGQTIINILDKAEEVRTL